MQLHRATLNSLHLSLCAKLCQLSQMYGKDQSMMIKKILMLVVQGMVAVIPIMLTVYAIYWIVVSVETALLPILPEQYYFVGMGWVARFLLLLAHL